MEIGNKIISSPEKSFGDNFDNYVLGKTFSANKEIMSLADKYKTQQLKRMKALNPRYLNPKHRRYLKFEDVSFYSPMHTITIYMISRTV